MSQPTESYRATRVLPIVVATALATSLANVAVLGAIDWLRPAPLAPPAASFEAKLVLVDAQGREEVEATLGRDPDGALTLSLGPDGERAQLALERGRDGKLRVVRAGERAAVATPDAPPPASAATTPAAPTRAGTPAPLPPDTVLIDAAPPAAIAGAGLVSGMVRFRGDPPPVVKLNRNTDAFCARTPMNAEDVIVNPNGTLRNVLVHVAGAPATPPPRARATVTQLDCMYRPRVQGIVAGQHIDVANADLTLHNIHTFKGGTTLFNQAQIPGSPAIDKQFTGADGTLFKLKCDVHPWMTGYVSVFANSHFAVTGDDGRFEIRGVPPGRYDLVAWHERYGEKRLGIIVGVADGASARFEYDGHEPQ